MNFIIFTFGCLILALILGVSCAQSTDRSTNFHETINDPGDPWETPAQELEFITPSCSKKSPGFEEIVSNAQDAWQTCMDSISPILTSRNRRDEETVNNASVHQELDRLIYMAICRNTSAYKSCWTDINNALNECEPGKGDVAGMMYFALYDEICKNGGRITVENRRKAAAQGPLCSRNYLTPECRINSAKFRRSNDLCTRFLSNTECDISSLDPNCSNDVDKRLHAEVFENVGKILQCSFRTSNSAMTSTSTGTTYVALIFVVATILRT